MYPICTFTLHIMTMSCCLRILELQVLTSEIVKSFTFSLPKHVTIQPATAISLVPIDSQGHTSLPLEIRVLE